MVFLKYGLVGLGITAFAAVCIYGGFKLESYVRHLGCINFSADVLPAADEKLDSIRFIAVGDTGKRNANQRKLAESMARYCSDVGWLLFFWG